MKNIFSSIDKKIDKAVLGLSLNGIIFLLIAFLVVWTDFMLRLIVGLFILAVAFSFFYLAYKIFHIKKEIKKFLKL